MPTIKELRSQFQGTQLFGGQPGMVYPLTERRSVYNEVLSMFSGPKNEDLSITDGTLRSEVRCAAAGTLSVEFNLRSDQPNPTMAAIRTSENRLDINDAFTAGAISVMIGNELTASVRPGELYLHSWPNPAAVAATAAGGFAAAGSLALTELYNGRLSWAVNAVVYIDKLDMMRFYYVGTTQAGTLIFTASNSAADEYRNDQVWYSLTPAITISGSDKTTIRIDLPDNTNLSPTASNSTVVVLQLRGLKIQNGGVNLRNSGGRG